MYNKKFLLQSYMEDHLKNKDRLDQEWAAICAYVADPSSMEAATDKSNVERNRPDSAFPYDHSRVVLNDLANMNNSDYINASTIVRKLINQLINLIIYHHYKYWMTFLNFPNWSSLFFFFFN